jgi:hypothetical protein
MTSTQPSFASLRRFVRSQPEVERCDLCGLPLAPDHQHLVEPNARKLVCSCDACAILFSGSGSARYRRVPRRIEFLSNFQISDEQWENLHLPINLAFFYHNSPAQRVIAMFPSPAGATESLLTLESWNDIIAANPSLHDLEPDVEALLVDRISDRRNYWRVPIDECYKLVGLIRAHWRGLSGGTAVWGEITGFFDQLRAKSSSNGDGHA